MIDEGPVLAAVGDDGVARLELNRPEASNGLDVPLLRALYDAIMRIHAEPGVRVVLVTGKGANFCAGGDVKTFAAKGESLPDYLREATSWLQISMAALTRLGPPVVAAVQGFAAGGGGMGLVCSSDIVVAAESAKFLPGATRVGMAPDGGASATLARLIGFRRAMNLVLRNPTLSASEALDIGLVTEVVPDAELDAAAGRVAAELAAGAPLALAATKRLMWDGLSRSLETALPDEARTVAELSGTADSREGLAAVIERRRPEFSGR